MKNGRLLLLKMQSIEIIQHKKQKKIQTSFDMNKKETVLFSGKPNSLHKVLYEEEEGGKYLEFYSQIFSKNKNNSFLNKLIRPILYKKNRKQDAKTQCQSSKPTKTMKHQTYQFDISEKK